MSRKVEEAYKSHRPGSRKGAVHKYFDEKGQAKAIAFGKSKGIKESTLKQWLRTWSRKNGESAS